jgi:hypothetical protein
VNGWTGLERRCRDALFAAMIPGDPASGLPPLGTLDLAPFWEEIGRVAPPLLRFGLRGVVWALTLLPAAYGHARPFPALSADARASVLGRAAASPFYLVRQMVLTLKTLACLAYLRDPAVRALVGRPAAVVLRADAAGRAGLSSAP